MARRPASRLADKASWSGSHGNPGKDGESYRTRAPSTLTDSQDNTPPPPVPPPQPDTPFPWRVPQLAGPSGTRAKSPRPRVDRSPRHARTPKKPLDSRDETLLLPAPVRQLATSIPCWMSQPAGLAGSRATALSLQQLLPSKEMSLRHATTLIVGLDWYNTV